MYKMGKNGRLTGLICLLFTMIGFILILFAVDKALPLFSLYRDTDGYLDGVNPTYMRYEKTSPESLLTVAASKAACREAGFSIGGYQIDPYPVVADMPSTEATDRDTVEIVVFGDSFAWGDGSLNRNELYWRQAEQQLRERGYNCRLTAVAMGGATAYEELAWYRNYLKDHRPDLVVFGYVHNDALIDGSVYGSALEIDYAGRLPFLKPVQALFPHIYQSLSAYFDAKTMYSAKYGDKWEGSDITVLKGALREYYQTHFADELDALTKETKIPAIVMTLPNQPRNLFYRELFRPLREIYEGTSVRFYDLTDAYDRFYAGKHKANLFVNPKNRHPGSAAHYFYGGFLADALERDFGSVLGPKSDGSLLSRKLCLNDCTPYQLGLEEVSCSETLAEYTFIYPEEGTHRFLFFEIEPYCLTYPLGKGYIKLCFENPVPVSSLELSGLPDGQTEVYYTKVNQRLGYDDNLLRPVRLTSGDVCTAALNDTDVTSLCIHVDSAAIPTGRVHLKICS